ncbi:MAG: tetratricopeptide repeat protein [Pseudomonadota bacterium]
MSKARTLYALSRPLALALLVYCLVQPGPLQAAAVGEKEAIYQQAREYLRQGDAEAAYRLLEPREIEWAGGDGFDYLLGVSALDSARPGEAIFSLQRLVARRPAFAGARLELARAYFDIGDNELARLEFQRLLDENPPPQVESAVNNYLAAIDNKSRAYKPTSQYYLDIGTGYDSNAPAATDEERFLNFRLSQNNLAQSSAFAQMMFGALWSRPVTASTQVLFGLRLDHRSNPSTHFVDSSNADLSAGWNWRGEKSNVGVAVNSLFAALDQEYNKQDLGATLSFGRRIGDATNLNTFVRYGAIRFQEPALEIRDVDQVLGGIGLSRSFSSAQASLTLTGSQDDAIQAGSPFSNDGVGVQVAATLFGASGRSYFAEASASRTTYDMQFFGFDREDDLYSVSLGASFSGFPVSGWNTTFKVNYSEKDSTVSLYQFDRYEVGFTFRKLFN